MASDYLTLAAFYDDSKYGTPDDSAERCDLRGAAWEEAPGIAQEQLATPGQFAHESIGYTDTSEYVAQLQCIIAMLLETNERIRRQLIAGMDS